MAQPTAYFPNFSFTQFQASHPATPLPAASVDSELFSISESITEVCNNLRLIQRDDGALANLSVGNDQLKDEVTLGFNSITNWVTGHAYVSRDYVYQGSNIYRCVLAHTSTVFATDLAAGFWTLVVDFATPTADAAASAAAASVSAASASTSAASAAASVAALSATSASSVAIGTSTKVFTIQTGKLFTAGQQLLISSVADGSNYMHGSVTSYVGATLTMNITDIGGSGTIASWNIAISGTRGATGATGSPGAGTGDMLAANNLSDVANVTTSRVSISAAKSGANSDITSLTGLTTPLSVAQGGSGLATLTAAAVMVGNGTSAPTFVAPGASGNVLKSNGSAWASLAPASAGVVTVKTQIFTSSGTYTPSTGMLYCIVRGVGGGASGAASDVGSLAATGGSAGGYSEKLFDAATIGSNEGVVIGAAGSAPSSGAGNNGGNTTFGSTLLVCNGGLGGTTGNTSPRAGRVGGTATAGDINISGGASEALQSAIGGRGGDSQWGRGGVAVVGSSAGGTATGFGAGGGGGVGSGPQAGGAGTAGKIVVTEFCSQ